MASKLCTIGPKRHRQIFDYLSSVSVQVGSPSQNVLKLILKRLRFVTFGTNLDTPVKMDTQGGFGIKTRQELVKIRLYIPVR